MKATDESKLVLPPQDIRDEILRNADIPILPSPFHLPDNVLLYEAVIPEESEALWHIWTPRHMMIQVAFPWLKLIDNDNEKLISIKVDTDLSDYDWCARVPWIAYWLLRTDSKFPIPTLRSCLQVELAATYIAMGGNPLQAFDFQENLR